ncbi:thiaminase II [Bifidobacterium canis]|uniref:Aminopyrimidine aminohydrolase n=1 Tax=Bifidobacterium canis TaxID=2610880 RepID=A0A7K1J5C7_9BIFI|nr:thiaminase II [Bifidobacterium canis]MUH59761.1 thiaminase II [Bifidobacterium canis]
MTQAITLTDLPPFARRMRDAADLVWQEGYEQPFIRELGAGTLDRSKFAFYLMQDELYLGDYAKVHALAVTKTNDREVMAFMAQVQNQILHVETEVHRDYLASFGLSEQMVLNGRQSAFARAYTTNMMTVAYTGDLLDILIAVLPCAWVYADYGQRLAREFADTLSGNPYKEWIDMYSTDEFWQSAVWLIEHIESMVQEVSEERKRELIESFVRGVEYEYMFWASAYDKQMTWKPEWSALPQQ